jgi:hypothetical protein
MNTFQRICVFCGASRGIDPSYAAAAVALGQLLVRHKIGLVYGGGTVGLMGIIARTVADAGGEVIGIIPGALTGKEIVSEVIGEMMVVNTMHERKAQMARLADAFIALPGGYGTLDELFEAITWAQLGIHHKPIGLLNVHGFFGPLIAWIDQASAAGFIGSQHRQLVQVAVDGEELLQQLADAEAPAGLVTWSAVVP